MAADRPFVVLSLMIFGLLVANAIAWVLLGLRVTGWTSSTIIPAWLTNNRSTISIAIQVISQLLGMVVISVLCKLGGHYAELY